MGRAEQKLPFRPADSTLQPHVQGQRLPSDCPGDADQLRLGEEFICGHHAADARATDQIHTNLFQIHLPVLLQGGKPHPQRWAGMTSARNTGVDGQPQSCENAVLFLKKRPVQPGLRPWIKVVAGAQLHRGVDGCKILSHSLSLLRIVDRSVNHKPFYFQTVVKPLGLLQAKAVVQP